MTDEEHSRLKLSSQERINALNFLPFFPPSSWWTHEAVTDEEHSRPRTSSQEQLRARPPLTQFEMMKGAKCVVDHSKEYCSFTNFRCSFIFGIFGGQWFYRN